ncbi:MAG TPA: hypothetical protein DCM05_15520 [Elusimicrobia bacterium]|nr:hypothetical protein [Elusimicrobiota bacterium]
MLHLLLDAPARYPAQWLALDRRMQVMDHSSDYGALRGRMDSLGKRCTLFFVPAEPAVRLLPSALR